MKQYHISSALVIEANATAGRWTLYLDKNYVHAFAAQIIERKALSAI